MIDCIDILLMMQLIYRLFDWCLCYCLIVIDLSNYFCFGGVFYCLDVVCSFWVLCVVLRSVNWRIR